MTVAMVHVFAAPAQYQAHHGSVITMFIVRSKDVRQKVASVAIICSWTGSMRYPAFHRPNAMIASRCACVFSCELIFTLGCPTHRWLTLFALPMDRRTRNSFDNIASSSVVRSRTIDIRFPQPQNVHGKGSVFRQNADVAILTAGSKRSFLASCTELRSQFAWPCGQPKGSAIRRVVERRYNS